MKQLLILSILLIIGKSAFSQVFTGTLEVDRANKEGLYTTVSVDEKYVKESWAQELAKYGRVEDGRSGVYRITGANIPSISSLPLMVVSRVFYDKGRTKIFVSFGFEDQIYINGGHSQYPQAEKFLNNFVDLITQQENVRIQQKALDDINDKQKKFAKTGDKLVKSIEDNKKEKERLLRKIEENGVALEKLLSDVEQNKKDQIKIQEEVANQQKKLEEARTKLPK